MEEFIWTEKYRPVKVYDCILPQRLKHLFQGYVDEGRVPNLMLTGSAGVGKTTIAKAMCKQMGVNYILINSSEERGIDVLRTKIRSFASTTSLTGGQKVIILDEADYLTADAQAGLRGVMEEFSVNCAFIMTCNFKSKLIDALHSRTHVVDFQLSPNEALEMKGQFFKRAQNILKNEGVAFDKEVLATIVNKYFPDYRRTINELQSLSKLGPIDKTVLASVSEVRNIPELYGYLKEKDFSKMVTWVVENGDVDAFRIYRRIYDTMKGFLKPQSVPQAIIILAKYQFWATTVPDQEVNLVAFLTEIMVDCEFN